MADDWSPDSWRTERPNAPFIENVDLDALKTAIRDCLTCSMSGHFPPTSAEAEEFIAELDEDRARKWIAFRCCEFGNQGIAAFIARAEEVRHAHESMDDLNWSKP